MTSSRRQPRTREGFAATSENPYPPTNKALLFRWLPFLPWALWPFSVVVVLVVAVAVVRWLPEQLGTIYDNWRDLARKLNGEEAAGEAGSDSGGSMPDRK